MRSAILLLWAFGAALAVCAVVVLVLGRGIDVLDQTGMGRSERLVEAEYCEHEDVFNFILGGEEAASGQMRFRVYLLAGPEHKNALKDVEAALRHCKKPGRRPALGTPFILRVRGSKGTVRYISACPREQERTVWIEMSTYHSPRLYRLLHESGLRSWTPQERTWTVPPKSQVAKFWLGEGM